MSRLLNVEKATVSRLNSSAIQSKDKNLDRDVHT